ncbi:MAG: hypothetical protein MUF83_05580 [Acidimicrobiales bacterium]|nr:hypothetical protein [Acidimicrobiales bacterium]
MATESVGELLGRCVRALGARRVFGAPGGGVAAVPGLPHVHVEEPAVASLLADADGRLGPGPGLALLPGRRLRITSDPGAEAMPVRVQHPAALAELVADWAMGEVFAAVELELALDLDEPVSGLGPLTYGRPAPSTLSRDLQGSRIVVLAGPGVVRHGTVGALGVLADRAGAGVVNTWGAKGVFRWDDPRHHGTAGLQARDFELAGLTEADLVIATGVDELEAQPRFWAALAPLLDVHPLDLDALTWTWEGTRAIPEPPELYHRLRDALAPAYASDDVPLAPPRVAAELSALRPPGGLVAADPGRAGFWVARTLPTTEVGSVVVPATRAPGIGLAAAVVAALDGRRAIAVVDDPGHPVIGHLVELALHWAVDVVVEVWSPTPSPLPGPVPVVTDADGHRAMLAEALSQPGLQLLEVPVALDHLDAVVDVAGAVVAWGGLDGTDR